MEEVWKLFRKGYTYKSGNGAIKKVDPIYISNIGNIRGRQTYLSGDGYLQFCYKGKHYKLHKAVGELFIPYTGLNPDGTPIKGKPQVNHKDENKLNNCVDNLEWCGVKYNCNYGTRTKRIAKKISKPVQCIETGEIFESTSEAEKYYKTGKRSVCNAANPKNTRKTAAGYHWQYI